MITKIKNGRIILPDGILEGYSLYIKDDKIFDLSKENHSFDYEIDADFNFVSAGFIDVHVHGGGGYDFMDGGADAIIKAANFHLKRGTTSIMPTSLSSSVEVLKEFLKDLRTAKSSRKLLGTILGAHLEGPYFAKSQSGAQNPQYITPPCIKDYNMILKEYGDIICRWSFAPELAGSREFCEALVRNGVYPSVAHSEATLDEVKVVYDKGCKTVTHLYSGMSTITRHNGYRKLGVIESAYLLDDMNAEIIADGKHLPPELLKMILKCKDNKKICLVTDAMRAAGTNVSETFLGRKGEETPCIIDDGVAKLPDLTSFAGSIATADRLVRTIIRSAGCSVEKAVSMITEVPAKIFGIENKGEISKGFDADIVIFDDNINIKKIIVGGKEVGN